MYGEWCLGCTAASRSGSRLSRESEKITRAAPSALARAPAKVDRAAPTFSAVAKPELTKRIARPVLGAADAAYAWLPALVRAKPMVCAYEMPMKATPARMTALNTASGTATDGFFDSSPSVAEPSKPMYVRNPKTRAELSPENDVPLNVNGL